MATPSIAPVSSRPRRRRWRAPACSSWSCSRSPPCRGDRRGRGRRRPRRLADLPRRRRHRRDPAAHRGRHRHGRRRVRHLQPAVHRAALHPRPSRTPASGSTSSCSCSSRSSSGGWRGSGRTARRRPSRVPPSPRPCTGSRASSPPTARTSRCRPSRAASSPTRGWTASGARSRTAAGSGPSPTPGTDPSGRAARRPRAHGRPRGARLGPDARGASGRDRGAGRGTTDRGRAPAAGGAAHGQRASLQGPARVGRRAGRCPVGDARRRPARAVAWRDPAPRAGGRPGRAGRRPRAVAPAGPRRRGRPPRRGAEERARRLRVPRPSDAARRHSRGSRHARGSRARAHARGGPRDGDPDRGRDQAPRPDGRRPPGPEPHPGGRDQARPGGARRRGRGRSVLVRMAPVVGPRHVEVDIQRDLPPVAGDAAFVDQCLANLSRTSPGTRPRRRPRGSGPIRSTTAGRSAWRSRSRTTGRASTRRPRGTCSSASTGSRGAARDERDGHRARDRPRPDRGDGRDGVRGARVGRRAADPPAAAGDAAARPRIPARRDQRPHVLYVEDEAAVREPTASSLREHGFRVTTAATAGDGLTAWAADRGGRDPARPRPPRSGRRRRRSAGCARSRPCRSS